MDVFEVAHLYYGVAMFAAALLLTRYSYTKSKSADAESRKAFAPLYIVVVSWVILGIASLTVYYEGFLPEGTGLWVDPFYVQQILLVIQMVLLGIASARIVRQYYVLALTLAIATACLLLVYWAADATLRYRVSGLAITWFNISEFLQSTMLLGVATVFIWIAYDSRRATAAGLAGAITTQILLVPTLYVGSWGNPPLIPYPLNLATLFVALFGPGLALYSLVKPDQKVSGELLGYGASFAGPVIIFSAFVAVGGVVGLTSQLVLAVLGSLAVMISSGLAAYLYGRWRDSRQIPTVLLAVAFAGLTVGQVIGMIGALGAMNYTLAAYSEFLLVSFSLSTVASAGIYAAGYRSLVLLPFLIYELLAVLILQAYPQSITFFLLSNVALFLPLAALALLPVFTFGGAGIRMRKAGTEGASRPLGLSIGILSLIVVRLLFIVITVPGINPGHALAFGAYLLMWLAVTGRLKSLSAKKAMVQVPPVG